jgi:uncharacterized protein (DUF1697 family)
MNQKTTTSTHIALLRAINVGGRNTLSMTDLKMIFQDLGCAEVTTYIQSGNVIFRASTACAARLPKTAAKAIADRHGLSVPVILRTAEEMQAAAAFNPFGERANPKRLYVFFLATLPETKRVAAINEMREPGEAFKVQGREIYLHLPNGAARTKFTNAYVDKALDTVSTMRNWNTVQKLASLARDEGDA